MFSIYNPTVQAKEWKEVQENQCLTCQLVSHKEVNTFNT